jgi:RNA polymerase sigma factor (TIGR02999 family)
MQESTVITELLAAVRTGDREAADRLFEAVYEDLRHVAHRQLSPRRGSGTLNTTALVHEAYLKLVDRSRISPQDRKHFFATAARAMRQIVVDYARTSLAAKRGGGWRRLGSEHLESALEEGGFQVQDAASEILGVDRALTRLKELDERLGQVVEMRFFGGLSVEQVAEVLGVSPRTVKRDWRTARAFLFRELEGSGER